MKKILKVGSILVLVLFICGSIYAQTCSSMTVSSRDACGQKISVTVGCSGSSCSCADMYATAMNTINSHTNNSGCFFK